MSVLDNNLSTAVTNARNMGTGSYTPNISLYDKGQVWVSTATVAVSALAKGAGTYAAANCSTYILFPGVKSSIRVLSLGMCWTALTSMTIDVGIFGAGTNIPVPTTGLTMIGSVNAPQNCLVYNLLLTTAQVNFAGQLGIGNVATLAQFCDQPLWYLAGYAADPMVNWDIGIVCTTTSTGSAGNIAANLEYVR